MAAKAIALILSFICSQQVSFAQEVEPAYKYVGNRWSKKFHEPSCVFAKRMWPRHIELFHSRREAVDAQMKPCNWCLPQWWTEVYGKVLTKQKN